jgi:hypothetical protein
VKDPLYVDPSISFMNRCLCYVVTFARRGRETKLSNLLLKELNCGTFREHLINTIDDFISDISHHKLLSYILAIIGSNYQGVISASSTWLY